MKHNPIGWFEIYVEDMTRAKRFYERVFGVTLEKLASPEIDMWGFPMQRDTHGAPGALVHMPGFPTGRNSVLVYFSCDDCAIEESKVVGAGGRVQKTKFSIGQYGFVSIVNDTEGNMIGLHSTK
jgi:predicted enzyme related to lactoylglutathione lyase